MRRFAVAVVLLPLLAPAFAQTVVKANQGQPGTQGPWPVIIYGYDGGGAAPQPTPSYPEACSSNGGNANTAVFIAGTATQVPTTPTAGRRYVNICNSTENQSAAFIKCRADGTAPTMVPGTAGDGLLFGDCVQYTAPTAANTVRCISDAGGGADGGNPVATAYECVPL